MAPSPSAERQAPRVFHHRKQTAYPLYAANPVPECQWAGQAVAGTARRYSPAAPGGEEQVYLRPQSIWCIGRNYAEHAKVCACRGEGDGMGGGGHGVLRRRRRGTPKHTHAQQARRRVVALGDRSLHKLQEQEQHASALLLDCVYCGAPHGPWHITRLHACMGPRPTLHQIASWLAAFPRGWLAHSCSTAALSPLVHTWLHAVLHDVRAGAGQRGADHPDDLPKGGLHCHPARQAGAAVVVIRCTSRGGALRGAIDYSAALCSSAAPSPVPNANTAGGHYDGR